MVRLGLRRSMRSGIDLRLSARRVAVWRRRGSLGTCRTATLAAGRSNVVRILSAAARAAKLQQDRRGVRASVRGRKQPSAGDLQFAWKRTRISVSSTERTWRSDQPDFFRSMNSGRWLFVSEKPMRKRRLGQGLPHSDSIRTAPDGASSAGRRGSVPRATGLDRSAARGRPPASIPSPAPAVRPGPGRQSGTTSGQARR